MAEKRTCDGCGKEYWWPARWQHKDCNVLPKVDESVGRDTAVADVVAGTKVRFDRTAYQREYMRKRRLKLKEK